MKKKNFVTLVIGTAGGLLFALGMCMALLPEWGAGAQGVAVGAVGLLALLAIFPIRRKMEGKPAVVWNKKAIGIALYGILAAIVFGAGMCMVMVWQMLLPGIAVGILGIVLLLGIIPLCKGVK